MLSSHESAPQLAGGMAASCHQHELCRKCTTLPSSGRQPHPPSIHPTNDPRPAAQYPPALPNKPPLSSQIWLNKRCQTKLHENARSETPLAAH
jgi:hypothetical protein